MWNPLKTLSERDSARLRRLEKDFNQLADDVEMCVNIIPKINARLRARATRAAAAEGDEVEPDEVPKTQLVGTAAPFSKASLLARARARGFMGGVRA